jgi:hypothetical protein
MRANILFAALFKASHLVSSQGIRGYIKERPFYLGCQSNNFYDSAAFACEECP